MIRAYKFLLRPTARQKQALGEMLRDHCSLYNAALQERRGAYRHTSNTRISYSDQSVQLKEIRAFDSECQGRWSFSSQQATLRRLDNAFVAFFRRVKAGQKAGHPRFKGVGHFDTVVFPRDGDGCRWDSTPDDRQTRMRVRGVGQIRVHRHRPAQGRVKTISIKREGTRWYVILACDSVSGDPFPLTGRRIGIDLGVTHFLTTSDGVHIENPEIGKRAGATLATAQRKLRSFPKRRRGRSKAHRAAVRKVAKLHATVRRQRLDFAHKAANFVIRDADVIACERLNISGMTRTPKAKPDLDNDGVFLPNGAAAKSGLNRSILDAGWGIFLSILAYKAESAGRRVIQVDARNTSRTCPDPECAYVAADNRDGESFACLKCGLIEHADRVGAINVNHRAGLVLCTEA
ncbi:RNA-guided endonuclease InsQ/TnpB family protein [Lentzea albidocapillata]|uniref:Putative transposase n=1 Tax=Lentzea albidocapillata TaxID=40571 RepID=A0A1W2FKN2_9PSEU|nr:RNA-guided endonuclease TnpB family protein [Lentzea albidocapillata]SMD22256.1 putative transposase [Lentzea albidocapillata]